MKKITLVCFIIILLNALVPKTSFSSFSSSLTGEKNEVKLVGSLSENHVRSVFNQIEVFKTASELDVNFLCDVGSIDIVVYDDSGNIAYEENVDTSAVRQVSIDISGWDPGSYEIRLIDTDGNFMYGEFDVE